MWLEELGRDLYFGFRNLRRSPGFSLVALVSLALGIGVNAAIFTLLNGLVLERLNVPHPERLVEVERFDGRSGEYVNFFSYPFYRELVSRGAIFDNVTAQFGFSLFGLQRAEGRERVNGLYVSGTYFDFLGARPYLGRLLKAGDDEVGGAHRVCVISYQLWQKAFGGNPRITGTSITINGKQVEVVGVTGPQFTGLGLQNAPDLEVPTGAVDDLAQFMHRGDTHSGWLQIMAELKPGITEQRGSDRLNALAKRMAQLPDRGRNEDTYLVKLAPRGFDEQTGMARPLMVLMSTVGLVLLIACLNLANLLLARGEAREREIAMRFSLGASRWSVIRQLGIESAYIAGGGAILGLLTAHALVAFLLAEFNRGKAEGRLTLSPDLRVMAFTALVATLALLLFGSMPAWVASRVRPGSRLQGTAKGVGSQGGRAHFRRFLFLVQVTLTMVLLFAAGLFERSLRNLRSIEVAEDPSHVVLAEINLLTGDGKLYFPVSVFDDLKQRVLQMPQVRSAAYGFPSALSGAMLTSTIEVPGGRSSTAAGLESFWAYVSPKYFQTLGIPLAAGRDFTLADRQGSMAVAIVSEKFASTFFPGQNPLGKQFKSSGEASKLVTVVGMARDVPALALTDARKSFAYRPMLQSDQERQVLTVRVSGDTRAFERQLGAIIHHVIPAMPLQAFQTMAVQRDSNITKQRMLALLSNMFGALALVLSAAGLYGLAAYSVARRRREVGIRMSVGATPAAVLKLFLGEHLALVFTGVVAGSVLALSAGRLIRSLLFGVPATDWVSLCVAGAVLIAVAAAATMIPASRAAQVDPAEALRLE